MNRIVYACVICLTLLAGCQKAPEQKAAVASAPPPAAMPAPKPLPTKEGWQAAFATAFKVIESTRSVDDDGNSEFAACFRIRNDGKCPESVMLVTRNPFTKATYFRLFNETLLKYAPRSLYASITVMDCYAPLMMLTAKFNSPNGWLFMDRAAIMVDGEIAAEHHFDSPALKRDNDGAGVHELGYWVLTDAEVDALRQLAKAEKVIIRLSGDKGYVNVDKKYVQAFLKDWPAALLAYDDLHAAVADHIPPHDANGCARTS